LTSSGQTDYRTLTIEAAWCMANSLFIRVALDDDVDDEMLASCECLSL